MYRTKDGRFPIKKNGSRAFAIFEKNSFVRKILVPFDCAKESTDILVQRLFRKYNSFVFSRNLSQEIFDPSVLVSKFPGFWSKRKPFTTRFIGKRSDSQVAEPHLVIYKTDETLLNGY